MSLEWFDMGDGTFTAESLNVEYETAPREQEVVYLVIRMRCLTTLAAQSVAGRIHELVESFPKDMSHP